MTTEELNPESDVLQQTKEHWQKLFSLLMFKLSRYEHVFITTKDIEAFAKEEAAGNTVLMTYGHPDGFEFALITQERAKVLMEYEKTQAGNA